VARTAPGVDAQRQADPVDWAVRPKVLPPQARKDANGNGRALRGLFARVLPTGPSVTVELRLDASAPVVRGVGSTGTAGPRWRDYFVKWQKRCLGVSRIPLF